MYADWMKKVKLDVTEEDIREYKKKIKKSSSINKYKKKVRVLGGNK